MSNVSRRNFIRSSMIGAAGMIVYAGPVKREMKGRQNPIRLGGPVFKETKDVQQWVEEHRRLGYSAAYCPLKADADENLIRLYDDTARKENLIIAEVGAWSNPISPNEKQRKEAIEHCCAQLHLADQLGANCCVNIAGSRNAEKWDGPHVDNLTENTFDMIVEIVRGIIDRVQPVRTFYTLETMPYAYPDSVKSYLRLIKAIDRKQFAVHLDPVNLINSPERYYNNGALIADCFKVLGPYIKSCHAKDIILKDGFPVNISECRPGLGTLDYVSFLKEVSRFTDIPVMLEHLETAEEYEKAADYVRSVGKKNGVAFL